MGVNFSWLPGCVWPGSGYKTCIRQRDRVSFRLCYTCCPDICKTHDLFSLNGSSADNVLHSANLSPFQAGDSSVFSYPQERHFHFLECEGARHTAAPWAISHACVSNEPQRGWWYGCVWLRVWMWTKKAAPGQDFLFLPGCCFFFALMI